MSTGFVNDWRVPRYSRGVVVWFVPEATKPRWLVAGEVIVELSRSHPKQEVRDKSELALQPSHMKSEKKGGKLILKLPLELMSRASFDTTAKHKGSVCFSNQRGKTRWEVYQTPPEHSNRGKGSRDLSDSVRH